MVPGEAAQLLPLPRHFEQASELVTEEMIAAPCGPDPRVHHAALREFAEAGFDEVSSQAGGSADGFFEFYAGQVAPRARQD